MSIGVLLIEGNVAHLELLQILIELEDDFRLLGVANDGATGAALATELQPDLIISAIDMLRLDGVSATPLYRQGARSAVIVLMSDMEPIEAENMAMRAGADYYIDKGIGVDTMIWMLKRAVQVGPRVPTLSPAVIDLRNQLDRPVQPVHV